jgi:aminomethyltransferase
LPAGLGARDTLRLEAGLPLCGTDMDTSTTPLEAGLGWVVKLGKGEFTGREKMAAQAAGALGRRLVGIRLDEPGIPRHGYPVWREGEVIGSVTSGMKSATLDQFIGLAYVATGSDTPGTPIAVEIRGRRVPAHVVPRPFYRRIRREG